MKYSTSALTAALAAISYLALIPQTQAFAPSISFVSPAGVSSVVNHASSALHRAGCSCPGCTGLHAPGCKCAACAGVHAGGCNCAACAGRVSTMLFADATEDAEAAPEVPEEAVPEEVVAMDGVESQDEAHNAERPARKELKKKRPPKGKPLSEFEVGKTYKASIKSVASYGAFCDFGASTDGLLHISRMSKEYVGDVNDVVKAGQEVEVRIIEINADKGQVALSLLSEAEEEEAKASQAQSRERKPRQRGTGRRDDSVLVAIADKGFDSEKFVTGKVVSTVAFGAFVRVDAKQVNEEVEGMFEGLVHISALATGRTNSVTDVCQVDDDVSVRIKSVGDGKVSLTMISVEDEAKQQSQRNAFQVENYGAKDWKESLEKKQNELPVFENKPVIVQMK